MDLHREHACLGLWPERALSQPDLIFAHHAAKIVSQVMTHAVHLHALAHDRHMLTAGGCAHLSSAEYKL